ncbi:putative MAPEG superfamily protein [Pseudomonas duriflava]|uniref:Putative MAPEG superfamily protein n=1 Tax=Pseudomonas duriflava TaxID=459528 RepID=A0A562Q696_9PSED|nr:MAPEG family protein [Pseudomonas duriflava]TWI52295.1 putative MAPEG superfamily protein [Pseudomonas duriflava]
MTFGYWCILFAYLIPYAAASYAKFTGGGFTPENNREPRAFLAGLKGPRGRAHAAQQNAFEITPLFAAAVIVAHVTGGAAQGTINLFAFLFVISRIVYTWLYIKDRASQRSKVWAFGMLCIVILFFAAV